MDKYKVTIKILICMLVFTTGVAIYGLLRKGNAVPVVSLFMYKKDARYYPENAYQKNNFWDNYPYWILISQDERLNIGDYLGDDDSARGVDVFLRFQFNKDQDSLPKALLGAISAYKGNLGILADKQSLAFLQSLNAGMPSSVRTLPLSTRLPLYIEDLKLPYFFTLSESGDVENIFVPRTELPEVTVKYLNYFQK